VNLAGNIKKLFNTHHFHGFWELISPLADNGPIPNLIIRPFAQFNKALFSPFHVIYHISFHLSTCITYRQPINKIFLAKWQNHE
jgi:hypothetical protein